MYAIMPKIPEAPGVQRVQRAQREFQSVVSRGRAICNLKMAQQEGDMHALEEAILAIEIAANSGDFTVPQSDVQRATDCLKLTREVACEVLSIAIDEEDVERLRAAVAQAERAALPDAQIDDAREYLLLLEGRAAAEVTLA